MNPVTRNFASVTRRVFRDRVIFSGGASSRFASSKCFCVGDAKMRKRSRLPSSAGGGCIVYTTTVSPSACGPGGNNVPSSLPMNANLAFQFSVPFLSRSAFLYKILCSQVPIMPGTQERETRNARPSRQAGYIVIEKPDIRPNMQVGLYQQGQKTVFDWKAPMSSCLLRRKKYERKMYFSSKKVC